MNNIDFELIIEKYRKTKFKAKSPLFPQCKGTGETKDEAITNLCKSISNFIKKTTQSYLTMSLLTDKYSEVITDPEDKESFQHRIIPLGTSKTNKSQKVFLKSIYNVLNKFSENQNLNTRFEDMEQFKQLSFENKKNEKDDLIFGINLCLN